MDNSKQTSPSTGLPNFLKAKILLPSNFNIEFLEKELTGFYDQYLIEYLKYGFPLGHDRKHGSMQIPENRKGAQDFDLLPLLQKEVETGAAIGPFVKSPFKLTYLSPLNSVPKKEGDKRKLIWIYLTQKGIP